MKRGQHGFTLIELLVVIAIIGVLSSVVLASLNTARTRSREASIKANLRNMVPAVELLYSTNGNYADVLTCTQASNALSKYVTAIAGAGGVVSCYSHTTTGDVYARWGAAAFLTSAPTQNYSVSGQGVVTWDTANISGAAQTWDAAVSLCAAAGKRLPSIEEFKALYAAHGSTPAGFGGQHYWSGTEYLPSPTNAYRLFVDTGTVGTLAKTVTSGVRCVQ